MENFEEIKDLTSNFTQKLLPAWLKHSRYLDVCGGARSGKTFSILQMFIMEHSFRSVNDLPPTITSVVSETLPHLKRGAIRDFKDIMVKWNQWDEERWSKSENIYIFPNGGMIEFFSADSPAKVHGPARDNLFLNEAQNVPFDVARQLFVRTRDRIVYDYNPTHSFFAHEKIQPREDCVSIHSTYLDNEFLSELQVREIESNKGDSLWWKVYGLGEVGVLDGLVYEFTTIDSLPDTSSMVEVYGVDFGFSNSLTAITHCFIHQGRKEIYLDERLYRRGLNNSDIADFLKGENIPRSVKIYCDSAEPKSISDLEHFGFNVEGCDKTSTSDRHNPITSQISFLKEFKMFVTKRSVNLIDELRNYVWDTNKNGERLNVPVKVKDHLCDSFRYAVYTSMKRSNVGHYSISIH